MPSLLEIQVMQRERLFDLLLLEKLNAGTTVKGLSRQISKAKSGMNKEDIAYVMSLIEEDNDI